MSQNDIEQIKSWAEDYEVQPSRNVWQAVESKLAADDLQSTVSLNKWLAVAASFVAIMALTALWIGQPQQQEVATSTYEIEALDHVDHPLYSLNTILLMKDIKYN